MTVDALHAKLLSSLKRQNPARVRAYAGDDDARDIAVPTRRRRWSAVIEAIEARTWTRVELLDKSGAVLGYVDNIEPAREIEDLGGDTRASKLRSESEWIVTLVVKAQREAQAEVATLQAIAKQGPERGQVGELLEALPVIMQSLPMLRALLGGQSSEQSPKPKNGA